MAQNGRSLYREIFKNFIASLKPRNIYGEFKGRDYLGTEYYESSKSLSGHDRPSRWFVPIEPNKFDQEIPPEWEAWLRNRRKDPPSEEEIEYNLLKMKKVKENAKKLEAANSGKKDEPLEKPSFPTYEEYNLLPKSKTQFK